MELKLLVLRELGLEFSNHQIIEQDTGNTIAFKGNILYVKDFDPLNHLIMQDLFKNYISKLENENPDMSILSFYKVESEKTKKSKIIVTFSDRSTLSSDVYFNDSLKYIDLIFQINKIKHIYCVDLHKYDKEI